MAPVVWFLTGLGDFADVEVGRVAAEDAEGYWADPDFFLAEAQEGCGVVVRAARQRLVELTELGVAFDFKLPLKQKTAIQLIFKSGQIRPF